jgi:hypothetical protein
MDYFQTLERIERKHWSRFKPANATRHAQERIERILSYNARTDIIDAFIVDKNHANGYEAHLIDAEGYIHIYNLRSGMYITVKSGRRGQLTRYYIQLNIRTSSAVIKAIQIAEHRNLTTGANQF